VIRYSLTFWWLCIIMYHNYVTFCWPCIIMYHNNVTFCWPCIIMYHNYVTFCWPCIIMYHNNVTFCWPCIIMYHNNVTFCWPCIIMYHNNVTFCWPWIIMDHNNVTNLIHFHFHNHFIVSWSSTWFGRQASIFRRHYTSSFWCDLRALVAFGWLQVVGRLTSHLTTCNQPKSTVHATHTKNC
jgi:hypothetical protein